MAVCNCKTTIFGVVRASCEDPNHCSLKKWIQNNNILWQFLSNLLEVAVYMYVPDTHTPPKQVKNKEKIRMRFCSRFQIEILEAW